VLLNARDIMIRMPSASVIRNANRPRVPSKSTQDDVFKVPSVPDLKSKFKAPDIAKEFEKANKAVVERAQIIVLLSGGSTTSMQTSKKSGVSCIVVLNLLLLGRWAS